MSSASLVSVHCLEPPGALQASAFRIGLIKFVSSAQKVKTWRPYASANVQHSLCGVLSRRPSSCFLTRRLRTIINALDSGLPFLDAALDVSLHYLG